MEQISRATSKLMKKVNVIKAADQSNKIAEQYRTIRANFLSSVNCLNSQTIIITSPNRSEGKSTIVANFAISLAQQGKKVLLIDADLRNSTLHSSFNIDNSIGLSNVLNGKYMLKDAINKTGTRGLNLLPSGPVPSNPAELLGSKAMESLIKVIMKVYDVVLFDTPSVLEVADAKIIANQCDGLILVIRWGKTKSDEAMAAKRRLESVSAKLLGVIVNDKR